MASVHNRFPSCGDHLRRPALYECSEEVERLGKIVSGSGKARAEMRWRIEAIAGSQEDSTLGGGLAERAVVLSVHQPRERGHAALRRNPVKCVAMVRHEALEELEVSLRDFVGLAEHDVTVADRDFRENLSCGGGADSEVCARRQSKMPSTYRRSRWRAAGAPPISGSWARF